MIWRFREIDRQLASALAQELGQPLKVGEFLAARGFSDAASVKNFIRADLRELPPPRSFSDMDKAARRFLEALKNDHLVAVCGDYDADGLTASALLSRGLRELGHRVVTRVPNRLTEGYGLRPSVIEDLLAAGAGLIVTVDNGISDHQAVAAASSAGIDVIITDHHKLPPELPSALAIINPHRDSLWSQSPPAGVGVAFMLLAGLKRHYQEAGVLAEGQGPALMDYLPLVAIGTVADMVPLTGPNRIFVRHGLNALGSAKQAGLGALKKICRINGDRIGPTDIGFRLAPRLNAAGRLGSAEPALNLLLADEAASANRLAAQLEALNRQRHQDQGKLCQEAFERLEAEISPDSNTVVLGGEGWPRGLLGLAASKVAEMTGKPTVLFSLEGDQAVGSGRSAGRFNLYAALNELRHLFISFGGHAQAAGLTIKAELMDEFRAGLEEVAGNLPDLADEAELDVDMEATVGDLSALWRPLGALEPFGQGNPAPVIVVRGAKINDARPTDSGGGQHMKIYVGDGLHRWTMVGFNLGPRLCEIGPQADLALSLEISEHRGEASPNWRLVDFRSNS